jgi:hypothetical protein
MPALPVTFTFPWLGPLGILPLPVKYRMYFGEPLGFQGDPAEEDAAVARRVDEVEEAIARLLQRGLDERVGVFRYSLSETSGSAGTLLNC